MNNDLKCQHDNKDQNTGIENLYPSVKKAINKIVIKEGYISYNINTKNILSDGGNCFGVLYEVNIKGETTDGKKQETNVFVKHVMPNGNNIKFISIPEIFSKEIFIYTELSKIFTKLQDKAKIPLKKRFKFVKIYNNNCTDAIILDNMSKKGFKTYPKMHLMKLDFAELCIEELAKFHSLAFLVERLMPEFFASKIKTLQQSLVIDAGYKLTANKIYEISTRKLSSDLKFKIDKWWETALEEYSKYLQGSMTAVKCLCHGDFKTNNLMYKEIEERVTEVISVDYQLVHYGSPVLDFIYFICMGTDRKFRMNHLSHLKDYYHVSLKRYLEYFNVSVDDFYPRKTFEKDFEDCLDYALVSCVCVLPFSSTADEDPDVADIDKLRLGLKLDERYYDRLQCICDDFFK